MTARFTVVKSSTLQKHGRWDAEFYLGREHDSEVKKAENHVKRLSHAKKRLADAKRKQNAARDRSRRMAEEGEISG